MGGFWLEPYQHNGHRVWKKIGGEKMFLYVAVENHWEVGPEVGPAAGWLHHPSAAGHTPPTSGWKYWDGGVGWPSGDISAQCSVHTQ